MKSCVPPQIFVDPFGRIGCHNPEHLNDDDLLAIAQLHGCPLSPRLLWEIKRRELGYDFRVMIAAERAVENF